MCQSLVSLVSSSSLTPIRTNSPCRTKQSNKETSFPTRPRLHRVDPMRPWIIIRGYFSRVVLASEPGPLPNLKRSRALPLRLWPLAPYCDTSTTNDQTTTIGERNHNNHENHENYARCGRWINIHGCAINSFPERKV